MRASYNQAEYLEERRAMMQQWAGRRNSERRTKNHFHETGSVKMTRKDKLLEALRGNPRMVRFDDACRIAEWLGFERKGGKGSHCTYGREGEPLLLNFQNRGGYIKVYQDNLITW